MEVQVHWHALGHLAPLQTRVEPNTDNILASILSQLLLERGTHGPPSRIEHAKEHISELEDHTKKPFLKILWKDKEAESKQQLNPRKSGKNLMGATDSDEDEMQQEKK